MSMMISIDVEGFDQEVRRKLIEGVTASLADDLKAFRCSEHAQGVKQLSVSGSDLDDLKLSVEVCCDAAEAEVYELLGAKDE